MQKNMAVVVEQIQQDLAGEVFTKEDIKANLRLAEQNARTVLIDLVGVQQMVARCTDEVSSDLRREVDLSVQAQSAVIERLQRVRMLL